MSVDNKYDRSASPQHFESPVPGQAVEPGVWQWELKAIREGVVRLTWDVRRVEVGGGNG